MKRKPQRTCERCGAGFTPPPTGRPPKYCAACQPPGRARVSARRAEARGDAEEAAAILEAAGLSAGGGRGNDRRAAEARKALESELLAAGLSVTGGDARRAAMLVGLGDLDDDELKRRVRSVKKKHGGLIEHRPEAVGELAHGALTLTVLEVLSRMCSIPSTHLASAARLLVEAIERLSGGLQPTFGDFTFNIVEPKESKEPKE